VIIPKTISELYLGSLLFLMPLAWQKRGIRLRRKFWLFLCLLLAVFAIPFESLTAFAAEVNAVTVNVGDTISYEIHVSGCPERIQALDVAIYYDSDSLEFVPYSLELPSISGFMTNTDLVGEVRFNAIDFNGFRFDGDKVLSNASFKVKNAYAQNLSLTYEIKTFLDENNNDLKDTYIYDFTYVQGQKDQGVQSSVNHNEHNQNQEDTDSDINDVYSSESNVESNAESSQITDSELLESALKENSKENLKEDSSSETLSDVSRHTYDIAPFAQQNTFSDNNSLISASVNNSNKEKSNGKMYVVSFLAALVVIFLIAVGFLIAVRHSQKGNHFS